MVRVAGMTKAELFEEVYAKKLAAQAKLDMAEWKRRSTLADKQIGEAAPQGGRSEVEAA